MLNNVKVEVNSNCTTRIRIGEQLTIIYSPHGLRDDLISDQWVSYLLEMIDANKNHDSLSKTVCLFISHYIFPIGRNLKIDNQTCVNVAAINKINSLYMQIISWEHHSSQNCCIYHSLGYTVSAFSLNCSNFCNSKMIRGRDLLNSTFLNTTNWIISTVIVVISMRTKINK